jgi:hypoxanthine phosphoribosyltransferase
MLQDVKHVLLSQWQINARVAEMARAITADHTAAYGQDPMTILPIMTGAMIFTGDLIRQIPIRLKIEMITVSSYPGQSTTTQGSSLLSRLPDLSGRHVLLIDDILDSGGTLRLVQPLLRQAGAASVKTAVLLKKDRPSARDVPVEFVGFEIPDEFVVGYGLDYNNYYRNLPDIVTLNDAAIAAASAS